MAVFFGMTDILLIALAIFLLIFVIWCLLLHYIFHWRPILLAKHIIAHTLKSDVKSCKTRTVLILWWMFFWLPFAYIIAMGIYIAIEYKPFHMGVVIAIAPCSLMFWLLGFQSYNNNGYNLGSSTAAYFILGIILFVAATVCIAVLVKPISWIALGYIFVLPSNICYMLIVVSRRRKIKSDSYAKILESEEAKEEFCKDIESRNSGKWLEGTGNVGVWLLLIIGLSIASYVGFWGCWFRTSKETETLWTGVGFAVFDLSLLLSEMLSRDNSSALFLMLVATILKIAIITFDFPYWMIGHGLIVLTFGTFFIQRFVHWFLIITICGHNKKRSVTEMNLDPSAEERVIKIMPDRKRPMTKDALCSLIAAILLIAGGICDYLFLTPKVEMLPFYNIKQTDATLVCIFVAACLGLTVGSLVACFTNLKSMTFMIGLFYFASLGLLAYAMFGFFRGIIDDFLGVTIFSAYCYITSIIMTGILFLGSGGKVGFKGRFWKALAEMTWLVFTFISGAGILASTLAIDKTNMTGVSIFFIVTAVICYLGMTVYFIFTHETDKFFWIAFGGTIFMWAGFVITSYFVNRDYMSVIIITAVVLVVAMYLFAILWTAFQDWRFTLGPCLIVSILSAIILALCIAGFILLNNSYQFITSVVGLVMSIILFGALAFHSLQKNSWHFKFLSIFSIVCFFIFVLGFIVIMFMFLDEVFLSITAVCLTVFIVCFIGTFGFTTTTTKTDVLVFSDIFFPVRRYRDGKIKTMHGFTAMFLTSVIVLWLWSLFASTFFLEPKYATLTGVIAVIIAVYMMTSMLSKFDSNSLVCLPYISRKTLEFAVTKAMKSAGVMPGEEEPNYDKSNFDSFIKSEVALKKYRNAYSMFMSTLKAQLFISSEVSFDDVLDKVSRFLETKKIDNTFLQTATYEGEERLRLYDMLKFIKTTDVKKDDKKKYKKFVREQEKARAGKLVELVKKNEDYKKTFDQLVSQMKGGKAGWCDPEFHPAKNVPEARQNLLKDVEWKRAEDLYQGQFLDKGDPDEMRQGAIGDCYFISAMSVLASKPGVISELFYKPEVARDIGAACVQFHVMGNMVGCIVDTQLPTRKDKARFVQPRYPEKSTWWFTMVEKAFAKQNGSYSSIIGGQSHAAFYRMIGGWPLNLNLDDLEMKEKVKNGELWKNMLEWYKDGSFLCAGSHPGSDTDKNPVGIVQGHAYSILQVVEVKGFKLLQLRNPWGDGEFTGEWGDSSPLWSRHPGVAKELNHVDRDDGIFWISYKDFCANYSSLYVDFNMKGSWKSKEVANTLKPGDQDGSKPTGKVPPCTKLPQYCFRVAKPGKLRMTMEKLGPDVPMWVYAVYNNGHPIGKITAGSKYLTQALAPNASISSWEWDIEPEFASGLWTIVVVRNMTSEPTEYMLQFWTESDVEITETPTE